MTAKPIQQLQLMMMMTNTIMTITTMKKITMKIPMRFPQKMMRFVKKPIGITNSIPIKITITTGESGTTLVMRPITTMRKP